MVRFCFSIKTAVFFFPLRPVYGGANAPGRTDGIPSYKDAGIGTAVFVDSRSSVSKGGWSAVGDRIRQQVRLKFHPRGEVAGNPPEGEKNPPRLCATGSEGRRRGWKKFLASPFHLY